MHRRPARDDPLSADADDLGTGIGGDLRGRQYQIATRCPPVIAWHPAIYSDHHLPRRIATSTHSP